MKSINNNMLFQLAFDNAVQANIISTVKGSKILITNNAACKLLGYSKTELVTKTRADIFNVNEKNLQKLLQERTQNGQSTGLLTVKTKSGKRLLCNITSAIFIDEDGVEKVISTIVDMSQSILRQKNIDIENAKIVANNIGIAKSEQKNTDTKNEQIVAENIAFAKLEQKETDTKNEKIVAKNIKLALAKSNKEKLDQGIANKAIHDKNLKLVFNSSSDVLFDIDILNNKVMLSDAYEKEFGYKLSTNMTPGDVWPTHIHPDDKEAVLTDYKRMLLSEETEWKFSYRFLRADKSVANVLSSRVILRDVDGKAYRMIGSMQDISKQRVLEEMLDEEIRLKEKQISDATEDARDMERSDIGKELHDNINQLLSASKLYLDIAKRGGGNSEMCLNRSSEYTITAIEEIRKLTKGLTTDIIKNFGLCEAIDTIAHDTMEINPIKICCTVKHFEEQSGNDKFKLNIYRIVQEQLNNILKHAKATKVAINLLQNKKIVMLTIADDGVGFDTNQKRKGIGVTNIKSRAAAYNGIANFVSQPGKGCVLTVTFPIAA